MKYLKFWGVNAPNLSREMGAMAPNANLEI
jgi:hypothetical protein